MKIAVAGARGVVGDPLVTELAARGHDVVRLTRTDGIDVERGDGLTDALTEIEVVIDVLNTPALTRRRAERFFTSTTDHLMQAGRAAGVRHHITLSIVGCEQPGLGYYRGKAAQEAAVMAGPVPSTLLRSTQFFEFSRQIVEQSPGPVAFIPRLLAQPVAAAEVAGALADLAEGDPRGGVEIAGPDEHRMADLARQRLQAEGRRHPILEVTIPGRLGRGLATGAMIPAAPDLRGTTTFETWLAAQ